MAQPKVDDFFCTKKKRNAHPAKRRKIEVGLRSSQLLPSVTESVNATLENPSKVSISELNLKSASCFKNSTSANHFQATPTESSVQTCRPTRSKSNSSAKCQTPRIRTRITRKTSVSSKSELNLQTKITDHLSKKHSSVEVMQSMPLDGDSILSEEITSLEDDHETIRESMSTPRKHKRDSKLMTDSETEPPKTRKCKVPIRKGVSEEFTADVSKSVKKKLELESAVEGVAPHESAQVESKEPLATDISTDDKVSAISKEGQKGISDKPFLLRLASEVASPGLPVSPLPATPEGSPSPTSDPTVASPSPKLHDLSQKLKTLSKMNGKALKNRLKQNGKLEEVKQKLDNLNKVLVTKEKVDVAEPKADEVDGDAVKSEKEKEKLPAHERFEHLALAGKPGLSLPFSYKRLAGTFQAVDTVVSMLHNRSEMCTFSKLKAAVQNFTKKNFEERALGQIKTVVPEAYILRQEKNVCMSTNKKGYALTIDADLSKEVADDKNVTLTPEGKPMFSASALINRKQKFHNSLLHQVMKHHKAFLATLQPPMTIPDNKITRWHPRFRLDNLPDIEPSALPQPPDVKVYNSAKDVLEAQRGKLNPRVEEALAKVVAENLKNTPPKPSGPATPSFPASPATKGIPPFLLAKIRAKEALKLESSMTRNTEEDSNTKMIGHLPEMIRILRSYFVTEKKPALPIELVYKKLEDSYRTGISRKDVEQHIKLLVKLAPELCTLVEIKRGSFLKLDRNVDIQTVASKIGKLAQTNHN